MNREELALSCIELVISILDYRAVELLEVRGDVELRHHLRGGHYELDDEYSRPDMYQ